MMLTTRREADRNIEVVDWMGPSSCLRQEVLLNMEGE